VGRRVALLGAAVIIAALGTAMVFIYVKGANDRALANSEPVELLVARTQISAGTPVSDAARSGALVTQKVPETAAARGALRSIDPIREQVALTAIFPGQQILAQMFGASASAATPFALPEGSMAVSFSFADPNRVAGFVQPGSKVAVFLTAESTGGTDDYTKVLLPEVRVVAVGPTTVSPPSDAKAANREQLPRALLTLALSQAEAEKMIYASSKGSLYLALLADASKVSKNNGTNAENLFK
jgi:pilus assembly protein CpaB